VTFGSGGGVWEGFVSHAARSKRTAQTVTIAASIQICRHLLAIPEIITVSPALSLSGTIKVHLHLNSIANNCFAAWKALPAPNAVLDPTGSVMIREEQKARGGP